ncbi:MAG: hypothetical protein KAW12_10645 [Candidatus Aminicenantes bacterium]|nr:hypothetical protein [Candidatus Aminicenantes bacterium]
MTNKKIPAPDDEPNEGGPRQPHCVGERLSCILSMECFTIGYGTPNRG